MVGCQASLTLAKCLLGSHQYQNQPNEEIKMKTISVYVVLGSLLLCMPIASNAGQPSVPGANKHPAGVAASDNPPPPHHAPPPEAFKACEGKPVGSQSSFIDPRGETVKGSCETDGNGKIVLRPDRPNQSGATSEHQGPPPEAYAACQSKASGVRSQFVNPRGETVTGTCEQEGEKLVLRPDRSTGDDNGRAN